MQSDSSGTPKKRLISRTVSEDEPLFNLIREGEGSVRRLTRSDSRTGTPKKRTDSQVSELDLSMGLPEMMELQAGYEEAVRELQGLEVEREAMLYQVNILEDKLETMEELLFESRREAYEARMEVEQEREAKRKLENKVSSLMLELQRLKEERNNPEPNTCRSEELTSQKHQMKSATPRENSLRREPHSGLGRAVSPEEAEEGENTVTKLKKITRKPQSHQPSLDLNPVYENGIMQRPCDIDVRNGKDGSPDCTDSDISAYEDAVSDTPERDWKFPLDADAGSELPSDDQTRSKKQEENGNDEKTNNCQVTDAGSQDPNQSDACVVS